MTDSSKKSPQSFLAHSLMYLILVSDRSTLLGKVLRVDVDNNDDGAPYSIPSDNPFLRDKDALPGKSCKIFSFFGF